MNIPGVKIDAPFSQANFGQRIGAGKAGVYIKEQRIDLIQNPTGKFGDGVVHVQNAIVRVSSSRIRMGLLIGTHALVAAGSNQPGTLSYAQIYPGLRGSGSRIDPTLFSATSDNEDPLWGQGVLGSPTVIQPQSRGAGYYTSQRPATGNDASIVAKLGATGAGSWPLFFEAQSIAQLWRVEVGIGGAGAELINIAPVSLSAVWEVVDPRDGEDSEHLLQGCTIDQIPPLVL